MSAPSASRPPDTPAASVLPAGLLTKREAGRRNRRPVDAALLGTGSIVLALSAVIAKSARGHDRDVAHALATVLGWAGPVWRIIFVAVLVLALAVALEILLRRRWDLTRDLLVAGLLLVGMSMLLGGIVISKWIPVEPHLLSNWGYPEMRLGIATTVLVVAGPELVRPVRLLAIWLVPLAALGAVVLRRRAAVGGARRALPRSRQRRCRAAPLRDGGRRSTGGRHHSCVGDARRRGA